MIRLVALLAVFLSGCTLHAPTEVELSVDPPTEYLEDRSSGDSGLPLEEWWLAFNDEHLNLLMEELFAQNLDLKQSIARLEQVEAAFKITRSAQSPTVSAGGSLGRSQQPGVADENVHPTVRAEGFSGGV